MYLNRKISNVTENMFFGNYIWLRSSLRRGNLPSWRLLLARARFRRRYFASRWHPPSSDARGGCNASTISGMEKGSKFSPRHFPSFAGCRHSVCNERRKRAHDQPQPGLVERIQFTIYLYNKWVGISEHTGGSRESYVKDVHCIMYVHCAHTVQTTEEGNRTIEADATYRENYRH